MGRKKEKIGAMWSKAEMTALGDAVRRQVRARAAALPPRVVLVLLLR